MELIYLERFGPFQGLHLRGNHFSPGHGLLGALCHWITRFCTLTGGTVNCSQLQVSFENFSLCSFAIILSPASGSVLTSKEYSPEGQGDRTLSKALEHAGKFPLLQDTVLHRLATSAHHIPRCPSASQQHFRSAPVLTVLLVPPQNHENPRDWKTHPAPPTPTQEWLSCIAW